MMAKQRREKRARKQFEFHESLQRTNECVPTPRTSRGRAVAGVFSQSSELYRHLLDAARSGQGRSGLEEGGGHDAQDGDARGHARRRPAAARRRCQWRIASTENSPPRSKKANSSPASPSHVGSTASPNDARIMQITIDATNSSPPGDTVRTALAARCDRWIRSMIRPISGPGRLQIKSKATRPSRNVAAGSDLQPSQPERIGDHADRTQRHGRRRDDRAQQ